MQNVLFRDMRPFGKLVMTFLLMGASYLVVFILTTLAAIPLWGMTFSEILNIFQSGDFTEDVNLMTFYQVTYSAGLFLVPALFAGYIFSGSSLKYLNAEISPAAFTMILSVLVVLGALPVINFLAEFNMNISLPEKLSGLEQRIRATEKQAEELMNLFFSDTSGSRYLINLFMVAVVPAFGEEFFFRGVLQRIFTEWFRNRHAGILVASIVFSFFHFQFLGFIPRILLGILFGYMLVWSGSIWVPVLAHFVNNATAVTYYFLFNRGMIGEELNTIGSDRETIIYAMASCAFLALAMGCIYIVEKRKSNRSQAFVEEP